MYVGKIIKEYLVAHKFDGLAGDDCGCTIDELGHCDDCIPLDCEPGYKIQCDGCEDYSCCISIEKNAKCPGDM